MIVNVGESVYDIPVELFNKTIELALKKILQDTLYILFSSQGCLYID